MRVPPCATRIVHMGLGFEFRSNQMKEIKLDFITLNAI
jgi:hypothetical protein